MRNFRPVAYATHNAQEVTRRIGTGIYDVRGGQGSRDKIASIVKLQNRAQGSKFIKSKR